MVMKMSNKGSLVFNLHEIDRSTLNIAGGKGANLGELMTIDGISVPKGFCISTEAFKRIINGSPRAIELIDQLSQLKITDRKKIVTLSHEIRNHIETNTIPQDISEAITSLLSSFGNEDAYAVRSSATAEDLPTASFAGQQDTYLNIIGEKSILKHVSKCWSSLFTERAITYRIQNGFDHRSVNLAVIVQKMVIPYAAGIMFTADPVTSNRRIVSIDASFGLGEALVSGLVNADVYKVRSEAIVEKKISIKALAIFPREDGGTGEEHLDTGKQTMQVLTDKQILALEQLGRTIEHHFGQPQDIEWCLADDKFYVVQSRPITTLFPIPEKIDDENRVFVSFGHQQMMTDAMKPLGLSFFLLTTAAPMRKAGSRLFVDITANLASPAMRDVLLNVIGKVEPLIKDALSTVVDRGDFIKTFSEDKKGPEAGKGVKPGSHANYQAMIDYDPTIVPTLISNFEEQIETLKRDIKTRSGSELFDFILQDLPQLTKNLSDAKSFSVIMTGMNAAFWLNDKMNEWLGEKNAADTISLSVPNNVTSEMGLALLDVADVIRPYPKVIDYLQNIKDENFLSGLEKLEGGKESRKAIDDFLNKYGMRCAGEVDITKTRWSEKPSTLVPLILSNIKNFEPGVSHQRFEQGKLEALKKEKSLLDRLSQLPDGDQKVKETKRMIELVRNFAGYREYPKYHLVTRYQVYKQALFTEAEKLVQANIIHQKEDVCFLSFEEFRNVVETQKIDNEIIIQRKEEFKVHEKLTPPRVITSDGEIVSGKHNREDLPANAIAGLAVSSGLVEGRARVILKMEEADIEDGDILVTTFTDPSWTPLFVSVKGLITEVGGLMTHGAVIAREYGLPAVVGVENATKLIKDGQRVRVNGTDGYIEML